MENGTMNNTLFQRTTRRLDGWMHSNSWWKQFLGCTLGMILLLGFLAVMIVVFLPKTLAESALDGIGYSSSKVRDAAFKERMEKLDAKEAEIKADLEEHAERHDNLTERANDAIRDLDLCDDDPDCADAVIQRVREQRRRRGDD